MFPRDDDFNRPLTLWNISVTRQPAPKLTLARTDPGAKVERVKEAVEAGVYENDLKLSVAIDRLIEKLRPALAGR